MATSITSSQRYLGRLEMVWFCRVSIRGGLGGHWFHYGDNQGLEEEVLKGDTGACDVVVPAKSRRGGAMLTSWTGAVAISIRIHQAEGKEVPGYNALCGPIVGSLQVLDVVVGISVGSFRDRLTSSTSGEIGWAFVILRDAGRRSDTARAHWITAHGIHGHSMSRVELVLER